MATLVNETTIRIAFFICVVCLKKIYISFRLNNSEWQLNTKIKLNTKNNLELEVM